MKETGFYRKTRRVHRWMGFILGIQFFFWTVGGLYFSWSDMHEVNEDHQKTRISSIESDIKLANPQDIIKKIKLIDTVNYIFGIRLIQILRKPVYQIFYSKENDKGEKVQLANAETGELRPSLNNLEAVEIAKNYFLDSSQVKLIQYLSNTDRHHEYRGQSVPVYAVTFNNSLNTTVYVAIELGTVQKFRNNKWRVFDFLWMLHTMDYEGRDNISNWLLRVFSIFGLLFITSGFILFFLGQKD